MPLESLIHSYGYVAIAVGAFLEGETALILGAVAVQQGYLDLPWAFLAALAGSAVGDYLCFYAGRRHGTRFLERRPSWQVKAERVFRLMDRFQGSFIFAARYLYGLRGVASFLLGASRVPARRFVALNGIATLTWTLGIGALAYLFGEVLARLLGEARRYSPFVLGGGILAAISLAIFFRLRRRRALP
jgi:membrane protein DedA with SNARE-associated domain